ncbi:MAG: hypothetical protein ABW068_16865 [Candidatus Thiodiazotropha sp.]
MITWKTLPNITGCHTHSLAWQAGISFDSNLYAMYHSLDWLSCLDNQQHDSISISEHCRDGATTFAAFKKRKIPLNFRLSRRLNFTSELSVLELLGCDLVGKNSYSSVKAIANSVWNDFRSVDAIYLKSVNVGSSIWQTFSENNWRVDKALVYMPDTERTFHYVINPAIKYICYAA